MRLLVPFGRHCDQFAVAVELADVGKDDVREHTGMVQLFAPLFDAAFVGKLAQHALELDAVGIFHAEGARDLARADFAGLLADKREDLVLGRALGSGRGSCHEKQSARDTRSQSRLVFTTVGYSPAILPAIMSCPWPCAQAWPSGRREFSEVRRSLC